MWTGLAAIAKPPEPVSPGNWTLRNWTGLFVYLALFILGVMFICYTSRQKEETSEHSPLQDENKEPPNQTD